MLHLTHLKIFYIIIVIIIYLLISFTLFYDHNSVIVFGFLSGAQSSIYEADCCQIKTKKLDSSLHVYQLVFACGVVELYKCCYCGGALNILLFYTRSASSVRCAAAERLRLTQPFPRHRAH